MKELVAISNCRIEVHGTQSILLTTRITGVAEPADFCSEEENNSYFLDSQSVGGKNLKRDIINESNRNEENKNRF